MDLFTTTDPIVETIFFVEKSNLPCAVSDCYHVDVYVKDKYGVQTVEYGKMIAQMPSRWSANYPALTKPLGAVVENMSIYPYHNPQYRTLIITYAVKRFIKELQSRKYPRLVLSNWPAQDAKLLTALGAKQIVTIESSDNQSFDFVFVFFTLIKIDRSHAVLI